MTLNTFLKQVEDHHRDKELCRENLIGSGLLRKMNVAHKREAAPRTTAGRKDRTRHD